MANFLLKGNTTNKTSIKKPEEIKKIESIESMDSTIDIVTQP